MFHKTRLAGGHDAALHALNDARAADGLQPFDAPSGRSQIFAAALLILMTAIFILVVV
jgi:hypothetical protein